jgi:uncharacterized protein
MKCPNCEETLLITERRGVEIDYCPKCRGVWLDKGELDKLLDYADREAPMENTQQHYPPGQQYHKDSDNYYKDSDYYKRKKRKSFLGDFFDFD